MCWIEGLPVLVDPGSGCTFGSPGGALYKAPVLGLSRLCCHLRKQRGALTLGCCEHYSVRWLGRLPRSGADGLILDLEQCRKPGCWPLPLTLKALPCNEIELFTLRRHFAARVMVWLLGGALTAQPGPAAQAMCGKRS